MQATQHIFRVRRQYNQWVANQTLEDYALRFTAKRARRWSASMVSLTALGATAFMALEAIGGAITLNYGFTNALWAMLTVGAVIILTGLPISYYAARYGLDIDLLTRGAGFGYLGSTVTSLIYASFTFIFFAIEAAILAMALKALFGIPVAIGYVLCAVAVIPIVTHGITWISRFQVGTQPLWLALQCLALLAVVYFEAGRFGEWVQFRGIEAVADAPNSFNLLLFGAASAVLFAMVAQIGEQVDYLRFLPPREQTPALHWWGALLLAGPGWILVGLVKMLFGAFLAWLAFSRGTPMEMAADPTHMYQLAFAYLAQSPTAALALAGTLVIMSQMKINVTNAYAGSIAWSNFFSRLTHSHPGRVVWLVFNVAIALVLMELGIYRALESTLGAFAIIAVSWLGALSADLLINKPLGLSPPGIEFKRAHLYDINPVGTGAMALASVLGVLCYLDAFGAEAKALAHFITLAITFISAPAIAYLTQGRFYIARRPSEEIARHQELQCCICENHFEGEDMSHCPVYQGAICSLCCSLDARCLDQCKEDATFATQAATLLRKFMPEGAVALLNSRWGRFATALCAISLVLAGLLALVYYHVVPQQPDFAGQLRDLLRILFFLLLIVSGVLAWLFLLAQESRLVAQEESNRQTRRLMEEIDAHKQTDQELQLARDSAEAANQAKSRYLTGISHELRTPLQSILGYAQLLSRDGSIPAERRESIAIMRRSGEYLADLIEGLLDVSRIEAGRLDIRRDQVDLQQLLDELVNMFSLQAESRSIQFRYEGAANLPRYVAADEKRLRQILINLLSNAVKFTERGSVKLQINYRNEVAEFTVSDTGVGIAPEDIDRVFSPFERIRKPGIPAVPGTGLGLTIVRLLTEIMGGDISVTSTPGEGSSFKVMLMLARIENPQLQAPTQLPVIGYKGRRRTVLVVDDEPTHRGLLYDVLAPLGFRVLEAHNAEACLAMLPQVHPDVFLVDVTMPGMNGLELSQALRDRDVVEPIIMVSADAQEHHIEDNPDVYHNAYLVKPIKLQALREQFSRLLDIEWIHAGDAPPEVPPAIPQPPRNIADHPALEELRSMAEIGYARGFKQKLDQVAKSEAVEPEWVDYLQHLAKQMRYDKIVQVLEETA